MNGGGSIGVLFHVWYIRVRGRNPMVIQRVCMRPMDIVSALDSHGLSIQPCCYVYVHELRDMRWLKRDTICLGFVIVTDSCIEPLSQCISPHQIDHISPNVSQQMLTYIWYADMSQSLISTYLLALIEDIFID